ncbi:MAG: T9SS type A sorting domain-containing protein [Bacteroidales bacterium]|nr:T9SS type A sorting domain-containing protein [Bacteroidales bacterium]
MKKLLLLISAIAFTTGMTFAQHGGGHPHGGFPGGGTCDSTQTDSINHPTFPADSLNHDSLANPHHGHPFHGTTGFPGTCDSTHIGSLGHGTHGFPGTCDSTHIGSLGHGTHGFPGTCDSSHVDSLNHHGFPFGFGDSTFVDSLCHHGHPWVGHHGHHGDGICDTLIVIDTTVVDTTIVDHEKKSGLFIENVSIYPNPVVNELLIDFQTSDAKLVQVSIYSISGTLVKTLTINASEGMNTQRMDASMLTKGNYLLVIEQGNSRSVSRFIK